MKSFMRWDVKNNMMKTFSAALVFFVSQGVLADQPCTLKTYASSTAELSDHVAQLYGFKKADSLGYLTVTCVDPKTFGSMLFETPTVTVSGDDQLQTLAMGEFYEGTRVMYTTNFDFVPGEIMQFTLDTPLLGSDARIKHTFEHRFYNR